MKSALGAISALVVLVLIVIGYGAWYSGVSQESAEVARLSGEIDSKKASSERASAIAAALQKLSNNEATVDGYFLSESTVVTFLTALEALGVDTHAEVKVSSIGAPQKVQTRPVLAVVLTINGSFTAVLQTLGAIEHAPYDINTTSTSLQKNSDTSWTANASLLVGSNAKVNTPTTNAPSAPAKATTP